MAAAGTTRRTTVPCLTGTTTPIIATTTTVFVWCGQRNSREVKGAGFRSFFQTYLGLKTFCPLTADGRAKAGFKVQRLSPGLWAVLPGKPALGLNFALKFNKLTWV